MKIKISKGVTITAPEPKSLSTDVLKRFMQPEEYEAFVNKYKVHVLDYRRDRLISLAQPLQTNEVLLLKDYFNGVPIKELSEKYGFYKGSTRYLVGFICLKWIFHHKDGMLKKMDKEAVESSNNIVYMGKKHKVGEV